MLAVKPVGNVYVLFAVSVTVAVYCVTPWNGLCAGDHVTALSVKLPDPLATGFGVSSVIGSVTVIASEVIESIVAGNVLRCCGIICHAL